MWTRTAMVPPMCLATAMPLNRMQGLLRVTASMSISTVLQDQSLLLRLITWPFLHAQDSPPRPPFLFCLLALFLIGGWSEPFSVFLLSCGREVFTTRKYPLRLVSMGSQGSHSSRCAIRMPPFAPSGGVPRKTMFIAFILCLKSVVMHKTTH
jgi:hypothetical protein